MGREKKEEKPSVASHLIVNWTQGGKKTPINRKKRNKRKRKKGTMSGGFPWPLATKGLRKRGKKKKKGERKALGIDLRLTNFEEREV